jgi:hypothetical protein
MKSETVWKCEQLRAGTVYDRDLFDTREEAENYARRLMSVAPDLFVRIEPMDVKMVWN